MALYKKKAHPFNETFYLTTEKEREYVSMQSKQTIGFIGTGVMGSSMARHLLDAGHPLHIFTRTKEKAQPLMDAGAIWENSVAGLSEKVDVIITMVGYPTDVEEVYFGEKGILAHAKENSYIIDMTTSKPALAEKIASQAREQHMFALDAPVSGGDVGAQNATLAIMVGGAETAFEEVLPIFNLLGTNVARLGEAGAGQHTKLANQIAIASGMIGVCETIVYAKKSGLDPSRVLESITTGAAGSWSLSNLAPRMIAGDYSPGFYVKHFIKDMRIALESAQEMGLQTPGLSLSLELYEDIANNGENDSGTQALITFFERD